MEGGRPPGGHAAAGHAPTGHAQPRGLAPSRGAARHHQEEQEEVLLVPLRGRRGSAEDRARDFFDAAAHRGGKKTKIKLQKRTFGWSFDTKEVEKKKNKTSAERRGIEMRNAELWEENKSDKGYDLNGLTGAQMLLLHLKCLFSCS